MTRHAFIDESARSHKYLICAATLTPADVETARQTLRGLRAKGQRRIHFATESDRRRRQLLGAISSLESSSGIYAAPGKDQVAARAAILSTAVVHLRDEGVGRLIIETRKGQDHRDRSVIYQTVGPHPQPEFYYSHQAAAEEPLLWIPDAIAWAWGRGGNWRGLVEDLGLIKGVVEVTVP